MSDVKRATANQCLVEGGALALASGRLLASAGALVVAAPTVVGEIPVILGFVGNAIAVGASAAMYFNCKDEVAANAKSNVK